MIQHWNLADVNKVRKLLPGQRTCGNQNPVSYPSTTVSIPPLEQNQSPLTISSSSTAVVTEGDSSPLSPSTQGCTASMDSTHASMKQHFEASVR